MVVYVRQTMANCVFCETCTCNVCPIEQTTGEYIMFSTLNSSNEQMKHTACHGNLRIKIVPKKC